MTVEKQIELESKYSAKAYLKFMEREQENMKDGSSMSVTALLKRALPFYSDPKVFDKEIVKNRALSTETVAFYNEILKYLSREELMIITCRAILSASFKDKKQKKSQDVRNIKTLADSIFMSIKAEYDWSIFKKAVPNRTVKSIIKNTSRTKISRHKRDLLKTWVKRYLDPNIEKHEVTVEIKQLMRPLLDIILKTAPKIGKDKAECVLFEQKNVYKNDKSSSLIVPSSSLLNYIDSFQAKMEAQITRFVPMIVPPKDWELDLKRSGGYYTPVCKYDLMHTQERACKVSQPVLDAVNNIQKTPWRVNKRVFEVMRQVFDKGGLDDAPMLVGDVPNKDCILFDKSYTNMVREYNAELFEDRHKKMSHYVPSEIHDQWPKREDIVKDADDKEGREAWKLTPKYKWNKAKQENEWLRDQHSSFIITLSNQLELAEAFKDYESIYFPQFLDWRGRIYATPTYLSPQSDKRGKALLELGESEPLGNTGSKWLSIHGCNTYGKQEGISLDKLPMSERVQWVLDNELDIVMSAEDPMSHDFWQSAEDPFGFLAFCFEWADYCKSGKDNNFQSRIPVAMDATCSGLQHFSALMRDKVGGTEVNLIPNARPNDIYKTVSEVAKEKHQEFINDPNRFLSKGDFKCLDKYSVIELKQLARLWKTEDIDRSLCKTPTMTTSYNVTISGITDQIKEMVKRGKKDIGLEANSQDPLVASKVWYACRLMGAIIKESVFDVVKSARDAQDILGKISSRITKEGNIVKWMTPMGLEVIQSYKKFSTKKINLFLSGIKLQLRVADRNQWSVNSSKSKAGLAPNFIHSLDACHLQMTVNACVNKAGLTNFAFIHDSFGTHASKTELMMRILREEFVRLYNMDVLGNTLDQWRNLYKDCDFSDIDPDNYYGDLKVDCVKDSEFFFS